jgi:hypothetical protein
MKENDIKKAFDKITLSKEKKNLIANSITEKREVRTGKKINYALWKQVAQVCLLIMLSVLVVITPILFGSSSVNNTSNNHAGLTEGEDSMLTSDIDISTSEVNPETSDTTSQPSDTSSDPDPKIPEDAPNVVIDENIPEEITYEYILNKLTDDNIYYNTLSGILVSADLNSSSSVEIQHNSRTAEYHERSTGSNGFKLEAFGDGSQTVVYNTQNKTFRVYNFAMINTKDLGEVTSASNENLPGIFWLRAPKAIKQAYSNFNREITRTKYLDRDCVILSHAVRGMNTNQEYENFTAYYYVDIQTGVLLCYECKNEAGEIMEGTKFSEIKFNQDLRVKKITDAGDVFNDYRELMVVKAGEGNKATAKQTIDNLEITMRFSHLHSVRGDTITVQTTVKNVGNEPKTLFAPTSSFGIQGCLNLSVFINGSEFNLGKLENTQEVTADEYTGELKPGESFTKEDVFYTAIAGEIEHDGTIEVRATVGLQDGANDFRSVTTVAEITFTPFTFNDRYDYPLSKTVESFNADHNLKNILLYTMDNDSVIYVSIDFTSNSEKLEYLTTWSGADMSKNTFDNNSPTAIVGLTKSTIVDVLKNNFPHKMIFCGTK